MTTTDTTPPHTESNPPAPDSLQVDYRLKVTAGSKSVSTIAGGFELHSALHPDLRRNTAANFHRLVGLLLLEPALMQLNGFVNDLRRADIETRDKLVVSPPTDDPPTPSAQASDAAPDLAPEPPLKLITA